MARVRARREELLHLKRSGGSALLQQALSSIIESVAEEARAVPMVDAYGDGGGGSSSSAAAPYHAQEEGAGTPASDYQDFCDGLSSEDHLDLMLRLQSVLEEEEAAAQGAAQQDEHEEREQAELAYLVRQVAGCEESPRSPATGMEEEQQLGR